MTIHALLTRDDAQSNWELSYISLSTEMIRETAFDFESTGVRTKAIEGDNGAEIDNELEYWNDIVARDTKLQARINNLISVHGRNNVIDATDRIDEQDLDSYHDRVHHELDILEGIYTYPFFSKTMPELSDKEASFLGSYTVEYYNKKTSCMVSSKGSWELFFHHAGITSDQVKSRCKEASNGLEKFAYYNPETKLMTTIYFSY